MKSTRPYQIAGRWLVAALIAAKSFAATAQSTNAPATIDLSTVRNIADRNIFDPNRTPRTTYARRAAPPRQPDSFSLVGVMSYEKGDFAFFDGTSPEFHKVARVDDSIATYKVAAIEPDSVTLVTDTNEVVLRLGDQVRDDGTGKWVPSENNSTSSYSGTGGRSGRTGRFSFRRNGNRGSGTNTGGRRNIQPNPAAAPDATIPQPTPGDNTTPPDDNTMPDNVILVPVDTGGQDTTPDQPPATATP